MDIGGDIILEVITLPVISVLMEMRDTGFMMAVVMPEGFMESRRQAPAMDQIDRDMCSMARPRNRDAAFVLRQTMAKTDFPVTLMCFMAPTGLMEEVMPVSATI